MRLVKVEQTCDGFTLDPTEYVASLDDIAGTLPPGAAAFARDPQHYDFYGTRCVKDLKLDKMNVVDGHGSLGLELIFAPNKFKHDSGLVIRYFDLINLSVNVSSESTVDGKWPENRRLGDVQLDEIWPDESGCRHEIAMTGGVIIVVSADLTAEWLHVEGLPGN